MSAAEVMDETAEGEARAFVEEMTSRIAPLEHEANLAAWDAAAGGGDEATERATRARVALRGLFTDAEGARRVRGWMESGRVADPLLRRQLHLLDEEFTRNRLPRETIDDLVNRQSELERLFYGFRAELDGARVTNNEIVDILTTERDSARRRAAWEASKQIGAQVAEPLRELVRRRNAAARSIGFRDAYAMDLHLQEIDEAQMFATMDALRDGSDAPFRAFRAGLDAEMAARFGVSPDALRPWHWEDPFGQQAPAMGEVDIDQYLNRDPVQLATEFFAGIGLPAEAILARSDLYEREGKDQHAFCQDVDRRGDVRILCNLRPNEKWTATLLHELGHAVYDEALPPELPFLLRQPAHILSTESVAMYFGRLTREPAWLREVAGAAVSDAEAREIRGQSRAAMLIAARWMLVMIYFERELYRDPDREDLNRVWWELVERLQLVRHPEARPDGTDWASKMHLSMSPVYYHNYLLGELMASQVSAAVRRETGLAPDRSVAGEPRVGDFFRERIFAPGASVPWNEHLLRATGEPLNPRWFVEQFVEA
ncbi:M2 family metallopeptidase [Longimicrobium sp.]|uniref:M2 family metallopeptidase n=1 Tax=Longimicrobium sp. TaxID=2029185 RepID=UPI003B3B6935